MDGIADISATHANTVGPEYDVRFVFLASFGCERSGCWIAVDDFRVEKDLDGRPRAFAQSQALQLFVKRRPVARNPLLLFNVRHPAEGRQTRVFTKP
jgi:hypothetical protein